MKRYSSWAYGTALALIAVLALFLAAYGQSPGQPQPGTVNRTATFTIWESARVSGTTSYSDAPNLQTGGADAARVTDWNSVDVFVNVDVADSATLTATVQFSPDAITWADSEFDYVSSSAIAQGKHRRVLAADGSALLRVPVAGNYMRVALTASGVTTPTVIVTYRNN